MRSVIQKTIYEIAAALQIPSLKFWSGRNPAVYVPLESENEILVSQNPTSSNVGVCNSVRAISPMHRPPPYCVLSHPENIFPGVHAIEACKLIVLYPSGASGLPESH